MTSAFGTDPPARTLRQVVRSVTGRARDIWDTQRRRLKTEPTVGEGKPRSRQRTRAETAAVVPG